MAEIGPPSYNTVFPNTKILSCLLNNFSQLNPLLMSKQKATLIANLPLPAPTEGELETVINLSGMLPPPQRRGGDNSKRAASRSGKVAASLPHGLGGCLCCNAEGLTCTIEMILVSTVLANTSPAGYFYTLTELIRGFGFEPPHS